jgi:hypothetical protein
LAAEAYPTGAPFSKGISSGIQPDFVSIHEAIDVGRISGNKLEIVRRDQFVER